MIKNLKKITITGLDQVFFALALYYFYFEVLKRLNDDDYATFTNYIGLIAFFQGISKIYMANYYYKSVGYTRSYWSISANNRYNNNTIYSFIFI